MQAIRVHPAPTSSTAYSPTNPAPTSALHIDRIPIQHPKKTGELLIRINATTVVRDMLTWPETYQLEYSIPGNDFSGTVVEVFSDDSSSAFKPGDEVFGMANANRGSTWAEYSIILENEVALKPKALGWEQAAALPLSAQTAYEALFDHAGVPLPEGGKPSSTEEQNKKILITGAAGGVGLYLVQLAASAGLHVVAATSSNDRNSELLQSLGADEAIEYGDLGSKGGVFNIIIDTVGGDLLARCWDYVEESGSLISVDSASFNFVEEHRKRGLVKAGVKALFFIVEGSSKVLHDLAVLVDRGDLRSFVARSFPLAQVREAYDYANGRFSGRGKIVITML
ncbi:zinc-containing alcohol dehydrogenase [Penicillium taxi]|uniref:zinc-containing alcohol dehydrogenase n=1 Tax=Penicillium taxi TaxID=168475 RepID=UPI0025456D48|nr:zinc-containing alcohol dehydrogenase [Penicillium taxi]KAJ5894176.1 zinc-containing alcohol dehydrogenase [Penicillium taxi]